MTALSGLARAGERMVGLRSARLALVAVVAACQASAGQAVRLHQRLEVEYLPPRLACLRVSTPGQETRSLVGLNPREPNRYTKIWALGAHEVPFYSGGRFRGTQHLGGAVRRITVLDAAGKPLREIRSDSPVQLLADGGYVALGPGYEMAQRKPVALRFFGPAGKERGRFAKPDFVLYEKAVADDGTLGLIIGPADQSKDNRFLRLSPAGAVQEEVVIGGCRGPWGAFGLVTTAAHAVFTCLPGPAEPPRMEARERLLVVVEGGAVVARSAIPSECGTRPVCLDGRAVAMFGTGVARVFNLRTRAWTPVRLRFSGDTPRPEALVADGVLMVLVAKGPNLAIDAIDLATGKQLHRTKLPSGTVPGVGAVLQRTPDGIFAVFRRSLFLIDPKAGG